MKYYENICLKYKITKYSEKYDLNKKENFNTNELRKYFF